jgi:hypothetical protein
VGATGIEEEKAKKGFKATATVRPLQQCIEPHSLRTGTAWEVGWGSLVKFVSLCGSRKHEV